jgi:hypothetical protein
MERANSSATGTFSRNRPSRSGSPVSSLSPAATSSASKFMSATQRFASLAVFWIAPEYSLEGYQNSTTEKHVSEA